MKGPSRLTRITLRHSSTSVSQVLALAPAMPALLTRMSMRPSALGVASRALATAAGSATSQAIASTFSPSALAVFCASADVLVPDRDPGARFEEALGDRLAEALRAAGDDARRDPSDRCRLPCVASPMVASVCRLGYHNPAPLKTSERAERS